MLPVGIFNSKNLSTLLPINKMTNFVFFQVHYLKLILPYIIYLAFTSLENLYLKTSFTHISLDLTKLQTTTKLQHHLSNLTNNATTTKPIQPTHRLNTPYELLRSLTREVLRSSNESAKHSSAIKTNDDRHSSHYLTLLLIKH